MVQISCSISEEAYRKLRKMMKEHVRNVSNEVEYIILNASFEGKNKEKGVASCEN